MVVPTVVDAPAPRHVLKISDLKKTDLDDIITVAQSMKKDREQYSDVLKGDTLLMIFEKPSLRTRVSLETGMFQMGGHGIFYSLDGSPMGKKETVEDTGKVLSRMVQGITARVSTRETLHKLIDVCSIPVLNALDDFAHPMQMLADIQTIIEKFGTYENLTMAYFGDLDNNMTFDLMRLCALVGMNFKMAGAGNIEQSVWDECNELCAQTGATVQLCDTAEEAMRGVNIVYCDSWMSYGVDPKLAEERVQLFMPYQVTSELMELADDNVIFMNCLPAARGMEQTSEVIDGPRSVVFDQAENRLHAQKALLLRTLRPNTFAKCLNAIKKQAN